MKPLQVGPFAIRVHLSLPNLMAIGIIILATVLRFYLIASGWPHTTNDEGTIGQMAMNIAYRGEHPVFFYGQEYMGALQAYLAAGLFHLFGVSLFTLRLALLLLYVPFMITMYLFATLLYNKYVGLVTISLLALGSNLVIYRQLQAIGGYPDTLLFGSLALLLASRLALHSPSATYTSPSRTRLLLYTMWGLTVGLGLWSDLLVVPCVLLSGLLLLLCCWRDLRSLAPLCLFAGLLLGALPLILFNLTAAPGHDSLTTLLKLYHEGHVPLSEVLPKSPLSAFFISLPTITSFTPVCDASNTRFLATAGHGSLRCAIAQGLWSLGILTLWLVSAILALFLFIRHRWFTFEGKRALAQLALLGSVAAAFILFAISPTAVFQPSLNARYLICVLIGTPAILYPFWKGVSLSWVRQRPLWITLSALQWGVVACIGLLFLQGSIQTLQDTPNAFASDQQQYNLVRDLQHAGIKHIYSDFWNCDRIVFMSSEQIACSVVNYQLQPTGDRSSINTRLVQSDPRASYVFIEGSDQAKATAAQFAKGSTHYQSTSFDGYIVFSPKR